MIYLHLVYFRFRTTIKTHQKPQTSEGLLCRYRCITSLKWCFIYAR